MEENVTLGKSLYITFQLDGRRYGIALSHVEKVVPLAEITLLPDAPQVVVGVIDLAGDIVPVADPRVRFHLPPREPGLSDQMIVVRSRKRRVALIVDATTDVIEVNAADTVEASRILPRMDHIAGVLILADGLVLIQDIDAFLSIEEEADLDAALHKSRRRK